MDRSILRSINCRGCSTLIGICWPVQRAAEDGTVYSRYVTRNLPQECWTCGVIVNETAINEELAFYDGNDHGFVDAALQLALARIDGPGQTAQQTVKEPVATNLPATAAGGMSAPELDNALGNFPVEADPVHPPAGYQEVGFTQVRNEFDDIIESLEQAREVFPSAADNTAVAYNSGDLQVTSGQICEATGFPKAPFVDAAGIEYVEDLKIFPTSDYGRPPIDPDIPDLPSVGDTMIPMDMAIDIPSVEAIGLEADQGLFQLVSTVSSENPISGPAFCPDNAPVGAHAGYDQQREHPTVPYADVLEEACRSLPEVQDGTTHDDAAASTMAGLSLAAPAHYQKYPSVEPSSATLSAPTTGTPTLSSGTELGDAFHSHNTEIKMQTESQMGMSTEAVVANTSILPSNFANTAEHANFPAALTPNRAESPVDEIMEDASGISTPRPNAAGTILPQVSEPDTPGHADEHSLEKHTTPCPDSYAELTSHASNLSASEDVGTPTSTPSRGSRSSSLSTSSRGRRRRRAPRLTLVKYAWKKKGERNATTQGTPEAE